MFCFTKQNSYFSFPKSQSFRSLKLLFAYFSSEVEVASRLAHQMYRAHHYLSGFLSCALIIALSMSVRNSRDRAAFKDNLQASFLVVCFSMLSCNSGCKSVASRASFIEKLSKHWSCLGLEGQFTGSHIDHSFLANDVR